MKYNKKKLLLLSILSPLALGSLSSSCTINIFLNKQYNSSEEEKTKEAELLKEKEKLNNELNAKENLENEHKEKFISLINNTKSRGELEDVVKEIKRELLEIEIEAKKRVVLESIKDVVRKIINNSTALSDELKAGFNAELDGLNTKAEIDEFRAKIEEKIYDEEIRLAVLELLKLFELDVELEKYKKDLGSYKEFELKYFTELLYRLKVTGKIDKPVEYYKTIKRSIIDDFNTKAARIYNTFYQDSFIKNFSIPNEEGRLILNPIKHDLKKAYYKSSSGDRGKPRWLPNEYYKKAVLDSFAISLINENSYIKNDEILKGKIDELKHYNGTAWILDYAIPEDGNYPTKWYIATNLHVVLPLKKSNTESNEDELYVNDQRSREEYENIKNILAQVEQLDNEYKEAEATATRIKLEKGDTAPEYLQFVKKYKDMSNPSPWILEYTRVTNLKKQYIESFYGETIKISFQHFKQDVPLNTTLDITKYDPYVEKVEFNPSQVRIIYAGVDFLKSNPSSYLATDSKYKDLQEMADLAIIEVDFSKLDAEQLFYVTNQQSSDGRSIVVENPSELARVMTNNYAERLEVDKSVPANYDILSTYETLQKEKVVYLDGDESISVPKINVNFVAVGFPKADTDNTIDANAINDEKRANLKYTSSLWTNKPNTPGYGIQEYGHSLSKNLAYSNFVDKPGITDITITAPLYKKESEKGYSVDGFRDKSSDYQGDDYMYYGLGYILTSWQPLTGSSGSAIRDINNKIIGINFLSGDTLGNVLVNVSQALRSPGYDYQGLYGKYKLEQYDLIYGGPENQRTSYRQALLKLYTRKFKTNLFPNGVGLIPNEYLFKKD